MEQTYLWHGHASIATCSGASLRNFMRLHKNTAQIPRKVFPEAQDIPRHGSGDLLVDRFGLMSWDGIHGIKIAQEAQGKAGKARGRITSNPRFGELCESFPAVTRLTVYRRPQVSMCSFGVGIVSSNERTLIWC